MHKRPLRLLILALVFVCVSCEVHAGSTPKVKKSVVEEQAATELAAKVNQPKPSITCPGDLDAKVGAGYTCILKADGETDTYNVQVTVTSVEDDNAKFDIKVSETPNP